MKKAPANFRSLRAFQSYLDENYWQNAHLFAEVFTGKRLHRTDAIAELLHRLRKHSERPQSSAQRVDEYCATAAPRLPVSVTKYLVETKDQAARDSVAEHDPGLDSSEKWSPTADMSQSDIKLCQGLIAAQKKVALLVALL
jgi:hypothetical protein